MVDSCRNVSSPNPGWTNSVDRIIVQEGGRPEENDANPIPSSLIGTLSKEATTWNNVSVCPLQLGEIRTSMPRTLRIQHPAIRRAYLILPLSR